MRSISQTVSRIASWIVFSDRGERVEELEYRAFGELRRGELTTEHPYGYTGKAMDPTTGIYDYGFRDYAPELARFTTVDPIRDGNNWYAYVGNDPVNFVDPLGLLATRPGTGEPAEPYIPRNPYEDARQMEARAPGGSAAVREETLRDQRRLGWMTISGGVGAIMSGTVSAVGEILLTGEISLFSALQLVGGVKAIGLGSGMVSAANQGTEMEIDLGRLTP